LYLNLINPLLTSPSTEKGVMVRDIE